MSVINPTTSPVFSKIVNEIRVDFDVIESTQFTNHVEGRVCVAATFQEFDPGFSGNDREIKRAIADVFADLNDSPANVTELFNAESVNPGSISPMHLGNGVFIAIVDWRGALPYVPSTDREIAVEFGFQRSFSF